MQIWIAAWDSQLQINFHNTTEIAISPKFGECKFGFIPIINFGRFFQKVKKDFRHQLQPNGFLRKFLKKPKNGLPVNKQFEPNVNQMASLSKEEAAFSTILDYEAIWNSHCDSQFVKSHLHVWNGFTETFSGELRVRTGGAESPKSHIWRRREKFWRIVLVFIFV